MNIFDCFYLPNENLTNRKVDINTLLVNQNAMGKRYTDRLDNVQEITIKGFLKDEFYPDERYKQIVFLEVKIKDYNKIEETAQMLFHKIKNAAVLVFKGKARNKIVLGEINESSADLFEHSVGKVQISQWIYNTFDGFNIEQININNYDLTDLKEFYRSLKNTIHKNRSHYVKVNRATKCCNCFSNIKITAPIYWINEKMYNPLTEKYYLGRKVRMYDVAEVWHELLSDKETAERLSREDIKNFEELCQKADVIFDNIQYRYK